MPEGLSGGSGVVLHPLPMALQQVPVAEQTLDAHGAPGVDAAGADADLGAEAVAEPVGEAGGGVVEHARAGWN